MNRMLRRVSRLVLLGGALAAAVACPAVARGQNPRDSGSSVPYNVKDFQAKCDGVADDAPAIRSAIRAVVAQHGALGGNISFPMGAICRVKSTITITASNIHLVGAWGYYPADALFSTTTIKGDSVNGPIFDVVGIVDGFAVMDLSIVGGGAAMPKSIGIRMATNGSHDPYLQRLFFDRFGLSAVQLGTAGGNVVIGATMLDVFAQNSLLSRPNVDTGVLDVNASDLRMERCFATASVTDASGQIGNGHSFAIAWRGTNGFGFADMAELSQKGFLVTGNFNRFDGMRAFLNQGEGFVVSGSGNQFFGATALSNSRTADAHSPGFTVMGGGNLFTGNLIDSQVGADPIQQSYGFVDNAGGTHAWDGNHYANNRVGPNNGVRKNLYNTRVGTGYAVDNPRRAPAADRGDASVTLFCDLDTPTQFVNSPLTANRTVTISNNGAWGGCQFQIVRTTTATGTSTLTVQNSDATQTKALAVGQWALWEFWAQTATWREVGFGSL